MSDWPEWFQTFAAEVPIKEEPPSPTPEPANDREPD